MYKKLVLWFLFVFFFTNTILSQEYTGFKVIGRHLYDQCGEKVILRGVSNPNIWFEKNGIPRFSEIEKTGANVVRIVWETKGSSSDLDDAINNCIELNMIPMIELHDATGDWSKLKLCVDYWVRQDVLDVIYKHESYLLINIANECGDGNVTGANFKKGYIEEVNRMRDAGIHVPLIIDGTDWGKNINILQSQGPAIIEADPDHNLMFSVHMWWPKMYGFSEQSIINEISESVKMELPLIVGEFSQMHGSCSDAVINTNNSIEYTTVIRECQKNEVGYIAWSWFGNCNPLWDMSSSGTFSTLYDWGLEVAVTDENSIKNTSVRPYSIINGKCSTNSYNALISNGNSIVDFNIFRNPSSSNTSVKYYLDKDLHVKLEIFDYHGKWVKTLVDSFQQEGPQSIDHESSFFRSGIYLYSLSFGGKRITKKFAYSN